MEHRQPHRALAAWPRQGGTVGRSVLAHHSRRRGDAGHRGVYTFSTGLAGAPVGTGLLHE